MTDILLQARELNRLHEINTELNAITDLEDLCWAIVRWSTELTGLDDCVLYMRLGNVLTQMAAVGAKADTNRSIVNRIGLPIGVGIVGTVAATGESTYVPDVREDPRYVPEDYPGMSEYAAPITHRGEVLGVIDAEHPTLDGIPENHRQIMDSIAVLTAPHLAALTMHTDGASQDYSEVISDLAHLPVSLPGNMRMVFANLTERAAKTLRATRVNIWLYNKDQTNIECSDSYDLASNQHTEGAVLQREHAPEYFRALESERVIMINNTHNDQRTRDLSHYLIDHDIQAMLDAPIRVDGKLAGVICVEQTDAPREWQMEEASFVGTLSDLATIALISEQKALTETALMQSQKMESLGRLAGGLAHDFNNLLTVISGALETLKLKSPPDEEHLNLHSLIDHATQRAKKLTRNLMAFGGTQPIAFKPVNAETIAGNITRLTQSIIREDIKLEIKTPTKPLWLEGDLRLIEQVLLNLMINAVDAMPMGGQLELSIDGDHPYSFRMRITDTGEGMDQAIMQKVFDPFFTTKGTLGTGLGLSICQGIIRQHKGTLQCSSELGVGSCFEIVLPAIEWHEQSNDARSENNSHATTKTQQVLLVEDEAGVRNVVSQMLVAMGYDPKVATNAEHALQIIQEEHIDLLLTDVVMPDMRGPDLYRAGRKLNPRLSALFVSGYTEEVIREVPTGESRVGYLAKPFTMQELDSALQHLITNQPYLVAL